MYGRSMKHPRNVFRLRNVISIVLPVIVFLGAGMSKAQSGWALPETRIPEGPPLQPMVATAGGQRLLLNYLKADIDVTYDEAGDNVTVNKKGWWLINYPLVSIKGMEGKSEDEICGVLFGKARAEVRSWYIYTAGTPDAEPAAPTGPAPIDLTPDPDATVSAGGSIQNAINAASAGTVIHVQPGTYNGNIALNKNGTADNPIKIEGIRSADGQMPVINGSNLIVDISGTFIQFRGFEIRGGGQALQHPQINISNGRGVLVEGCLLKDSDAAGLNASCQASATQQMEPTVVRGNWIVNAYQVAFKAHTVANPYVFNESQQNTTVNGRLPVIMEYNYVTGCEGKNTQYSGLWESGGFKVFHQSGSVYRYNTMEDNYSLALWLDWGHFNNRVEGNYARNHEVLGVGVEASCGPNLVCNNVVIDQKGLGMVPDKPEWGDYFKGSILSWDCNNTWAVNNTVDGANAGAIGIHLRGCIKDRNMPWEPFDKYTEVGINNAIVRADTAIKDADYPDDVFEANYCDQGPGAEEIDMSDAFVDRDGHDLRLKPDHQLNTLGVSNDYTAFVKHDFYGLLRFDEDGKSVGAFRPWPNDRSGTLVEVEYADGTIERKQSGTTTRKGAGGAKSTDLAGLEIRLQRGGIELRGIPADARPRFADMRGREVPLNWRTECGRLMADTKSVPPGAYVVRVRTHARSMERRAIIQ